MKIVNLVVDNFRAIERVELSGLQDMIVIAGPNGCGKSCILDSIRLFKSVYGGYQPNEWQQWLSEFQINFQRDPQQMVSLLKNPSRPSVIQADIKLADEEIRFIKRHIRQLLEDLVWKTVVPGSQRRGQSQSALAAELRAHQPMVNQKIEEYLPIVQELLKQDVLRGKLQIDTNGVAVTTGNVLLELIFSSYHPKNIGLIDFHGAHRNYAREQLGGINLNLDQNEDRFRTTSLYSSGNKYSNIKSEMAAEFVKQALIEKAPVGLLSTTATRPLAETLQELFTIFFPDKKFLGPVPTEDGNLNFPVEIQDGSTHDINDLSSGEKEILFGYLRLRSSAPGYSVILLDEPELHLNPALVRGLPQFYYKHMGLELENQIWLVTHSDAFLREAMGHDGLRVFHMQHPAVSGGTENQIQEIRHGEEAETLILEMVGNLATYRPGAKVVFFEGEDSEFDLNMVSRLFPTMVNELNFVSGGNRFRVEALHRTLAQSVQAGNIPIKIYSVVDKDSGAKVTPSAEFSRHYSWDVYHIENYLLEPSFISEVLENLDVVHDDVLSVEKIEHRLATIAADQIGKLVSHKVRAEMWAELNKDLNLNINPLSDDIGAELHKSVEKSIERMNQRVGNSLHIDNIRDKVRREREILKESLNTGDWKKHFKGRDILSVFAGDYVRGLGYEFFRNLIISQMVNAGYQPQGMKAVLDGIVNDSRL